MQLADCCLFASKFVTHKNLKYMRNGVYLTLYDYIMLKPVCFIILTFCHNKHRFTFSKADVSLNKTLKFNLQHNKSQNKKEGFQKIL